MSEKKTARREAKPVSRAPTLTTGWAAALFALLVVMLFHEVALQGRTFVSPDTNQPLGFVRVGEQALYQQHVYPLWNPFVFLGMPSFGSGAYNPLIYPPDWPLALIAKVVPLPDMTWMLLYYFLGGLFMFLLAREWGARAEGAVLAGAAFVFAPNLVAVGSHGHGSQLVNSAYLPLLLWLAARWLRRGSLADLGWLALAGGFQMLRGHVQICFYSWLAVGLYAIVEWLAALRTPGRLGTVTARTLGIPVAAALAFGLAGFYNLSLRDYARWSIRGGGAGGGVGMEYATQWSLSPIELPSIVVPGWAGFGGQLYWGGMPFTDYPNAYLGLVAVLLALPAFLSNGPRRLFALALAAIALFVAFGRNFPLYGFLYDHLPLFNKFRVPVMIVILFQLAAALALAWGWTAVLDGAAGKPARGAKAPAIDRLLLGAGALTALALVAGVLGAGAWRDAYVSLATATKAQYPAEAARFAYGLFVGDLGRACVLGLLALGAAWLARRGRLPSGVASVAVLALLLIELWPVSGRVMKPTIGEVAQRSVDAGRDDVVEFLEKSGPAGSFRILPIDEYQSNRFAGFGIATVGGYQPAKPRRFQDFFEAGLVDNPMWWRVLNVRYVVTAQKLDPPPPFLTPVFTGASATVYEMTAALPRVTVLGEYRVVTPARAILDSVARGNTDAARVVFLEKDPGVRLGRVSGAKAQITSYRLNDVTVAVVTPAPALLRLADAWYPDWTVSVDGKRAELLAADYLLRAVAVPAGRHEVVFRFEPPAFRRGLILSLASLVVILGALLAGRWRRPAGAPAGGTS